MILAMAGGTPDHAALAAAVVASLNRQLEGKKCRVYSEALRIRVLSTGFAGYPDVTVVRTKPREPTWNRVQATPSTVSSTAASLRPWYQSRRVASAHLTIEQLSMLLDR